MRYVTAYISFHSNELKMSIIEASSQLDAMKLALSAEDWTEIEGDTPEAVKQFAFDGDCMVNAIEVP